MSISRFSEDKRGNIALIGALTLPFMVGGLALGTDATNWFLDKSELIVAADAAALSAARLYNRGVAEADIKTAVRANLVARGFPTASLTVDIIYPAAMDGVLQLDASFQAKKYLSAVVFPGTATVNARTKVQMDPGEACVIALNPTAGNAFTMTGSSSATLNGCNVASNSNHAASIYLGGASLITTDCLIASGGITGDDKATTQCENNRTYARPTPDPFLGTPIPTTPASCTNPPNFKPNKSFTVSPGCFKNDLDLKGNVTLQPGVYVLDGSTLKINSNAVVNGTGVTFVLKNGANLDFNGGAEINFTAPLKGSGATYEGMLFVGSPTNSAAHTINGNASSVFKGVMYFPDDDVTFTGSAGMDVGCIRLVADTIEMKGNADMVSTCDVENGGKKILTVGQVYIIE